MTVRLGNCARCFQPTPAASIERFSFGGSTYNLPLCDPHADMFLTDMFAWSRCGVLDESLVPARPAAERKRGTVMKAHVHVPAARTPEGSEQAMAEVIVLPEPVKKPAVDYAELGLPEGWDTWKFSEHAMDRRESRLVSPIEAMWAAQAPDVVRPGKTEGTSVHTKGHVQVVVNPAQRIIVTVINRNLRTESEDLAHAAS